MPDEVQEAGTGDTGELTGEQVTQSETGETDAQGGQEGQPAEEPKYKGKPAAELVKTIEEQRKLIGKQSAEVGEVRALKSQIAELQQYVASIPQYMQQFVAQSQPQHGQTQGQPQGQQGPDFYSDPQGWFERRLNAEFNRREQARMASEQSRVASEAQTAAMLGKRAAMQSDPELFAGVEDIVETNIRESFRTNRFPIQMLSDPETWKTVARFAWGLQGQWEKAMPKKMAMKPGKMETPGRSRVDDEDIEDVTLDEEERRMLKKAGLSEKDGVDLKKVELKRKGRG